MKIAVIGNAGSGKSTLAHALHKKLRLPLYHLDQYFWLPNWQHPDRAEFKKVHDALCDKEQWIIEGMAIRILEYRIQKADIVIYLDIPLYTCFYRIFKRAFLNFNKVNWAGPQGCPERRPSLEFLKYVWNFSKDRKPMILALLKKYSDTKTIFVLTSQEEINQFIQDFGE